MNPTPTFTRDAALDRVRGAYAVVVSGKTVRRHLYFNLPSAEQAMRRAAEKGYTAHLIAVRLEVLEEVFDDA